MTRGRIIALVALVLLGCGSTPQALSRFAGPNALVPFRGVTGKRAGVNDYLAVAASRGDDLRFVDPADLEPVVGPGATFPLSVPTAPRPLLLASASLNDSGADVLVAVSSGGAGLFGTGPALQVIETWDGTNRVAYDVSLPLAAGTQIVSLLGLPAPSAGLPARILIGTDHKQLVVAGFTRATDGSGGVTPLPAPSILSIGFEPIDIAPDPSGKILYIATRDPIPPNNIFGVAVINTSADTSASSPQTWTLSSLAAGPTDPLTTPPKMGVGTVAVAAAANVFERTINSGIQNSADNISVPAPSGSATPTPTLVFAALDPDACGPSASINCGIVAIDPNSTRTDAMGNLAPDPAACLLPGSTSCTVLTSDSGPAAAVAQPYRAPMPVPDAPNHIAIGHAPASGTQQIINPNNANAPLFSILPGTGQRNTNAVAMVTSNSGFVYWFDLSRWGPPSESQVVLSSTGTHVSVASASQVAVPGANYQIGLWVDAPPLGGPSGFVTADPGTLPTAIDVWPGFTFSDWWSIGYQGLLPSLAGRAGILTVSGSNVYAAVQTESDAVTTDPTNPAHWTAGANLADGTLGVRAGDIVDLGNGCETTIVGQPISPNTTSGSAPVPTPGGAVNLSLAPGCVPVPAVASGQLFLPTTISIRVPGLLLTSVTLGYLGRPAISRTNDQSAIQSDTFGFSWRDERALAAQQTTNPLAREQVAIARKARRLFYSSDEPCPIAGSGGGSEGALSVGCYGSELKRLADPLAPGPVVRFRVGLTGPNPSDPGSFPARGAGINFNTQIGLVQTSRRPISGGAQPAGILFFDRTTPARIGTPQYSGHQNDPTFFFVPYGDDQVLLFSPSQSASESTSIR